MIEIDKNKCIYCGACVSVCPVMANILKETFIEHDAEKCINCANCVKACPMKAIKLVEKKE